MEESKQNVEGSGDEKHAHPKFQAACSLWVDLLAHAVADGEEEATPTLAGLAAHTELPPPSPASL